MIDPGKTNNMYKDSKILNNIIYLTQNNKLNWSKISENSNIIIYTTNHIITTNKFVQIDFIYDKLKNVFTSIVFNYINDNNNNKKEIIEIYPNSKSIFIKYNLSNKLKKLLKYIK